MSGARDLERGSALLIVLVFAAIIAISLYAELPIVAFESQRQKEQLLVDRGNEYARGVKLYVRKIGQYPPSFEAMENTNRMRFLRKRYKDPFTGKDDWRLLHAGPGGLIIDSKVNPVAANGAAGANGTNNPGAANGNSPGNTGFSSPGAANSASGGFNNNNGSANSGFGGFNSGPSSNNGNNAGAGFPSQNTAQNTPQNAGQNGAAFGGSNSGSGNNNGGFGGYLSSLNSSSGAGNPQAPSGIAMRQRAAMAAIGNPGAGQAGTAAGLGNPGSSPDAQMSNPPLPNNSNPNTGVQNGPGMQVSVGQNAPQNPGIGNNQNSPFNNQSGAFGNRAAGGANTTGGLGSLSASSSSSGMGVVQSGGIAGVASKADATSIKTVNDQENYKLWEFVYDMSKDAARQAAGATNQTGAAAGSTNPGNSGFGQQGTGTPGNSAFGNSGFGGNSGSGNQQNSPFGNSNSNGFGNSSTGFGNSNSGFGNSNRGFGSSTTNSGNGFNNGWSGNTNSNNNNLNGPQNQSAPTTGRPQEQY